MQVTDLYFCRALHLDLRATAAHKDKREGQYDWGEHKEKDAGARVGQIFSTLSTTGANAFGRFGYNGL
jgi:hypothetical protein